MIAPKEKKPKNVILLKLKAILEIKGSVSNNELKSIDSFTFLHQRKRPIIKYAKLSVIKSYVIGRVQRFNFFSAHHFSDRLYSELLRTQIKVHIFLSLSLSLSSFLFIFSLTEL